MQRVLEMTDIKAHLLAAWFMPDRAAHARKGGFPQEQKEKPLFLNERSKEFLRIQECALPNDVLQPFIENRTFAEINVGDMAHIQRTVASFACHHAIAPPS